MTKLSNALLLLFLSVAPAAAWDISDMNTQIDQTNFLVNDNCSATLIDMKKGRLLTANHCISDQFQIIEREEIQDDGTVKTRKVRVAVPGTVSQMFFSGPAQTQKNSYTFKIVKNDASTDLALIETLGPLPNIQQAPVACKEPVRGETVFAVGNTLAVLYATVSKGIVSNVHRSYRNIGVDDDHGLVQTTAAVAGGNSGGALYNDRGELSGVVVRGYQNVAPISLVVPLSDVRKFLGMGDC